MPPNSGRSSGSVVFQVKYQCVAMQVKGAGKDGVWAEDSARMDGFTEVVLYLVLVTVTR